jgi:hypothetical protein
MRLRITHSDLTGRVQLGHRPGWTSTGSIDGWCIVPDATRLLGHGLDLDALVAPRVTAALRALAEARVRLWRAARVLRHGQDPWR